MKSMLTDSSASFTTTGAGLRGCPVLVMDRDDGTLVSSRVYRNTATRLYLDAPLTREPDRYDAYWVGAIPMSLESGDLTFGMPRAVKSLEYATFEFERPANGLMVLYLSADSESETETDWQIAGYVPLKGRTYYRLPLNVAAATGRVIRYCLMTISPGWPVVLTHFSFEWSTADGFEG